MRKSKYVTEVLAFLFEEGLSPKDVKSVEQNAGSIWFSMENGAILSR